MTNPAMLAPVVSHRPVKSGVGFSLCGQLLPETTPDAPACVVCEAIHRDQRTYGDQPMNAVITGTVTAYGYHALNALTSGTGNTVYDRDGLELRGDTVRLGAPA